MIDDDGIVLNDHIARCKFWNHHPIAAPDNLLFPCQWLTASLLIVASLLLLGGVGFCCFVAVGRAVAMV
jgi:hypothetical protein